MDYLMSLKGKQTVAVLTFQCLFCSCIIEIYRVFIPICHFMTTYISITVEDMKTKLFFEN